MKQEWKIIDKVAEGSSVIVEKVKIPSKGIKLEGEFSLPPLAILSEQDQFFAAAFIVCHGSIKEMEKMFGISYPTVKNRLNKIAARLDFMKIDVSRIKEKGSKEGLKALEKLEKGEINLEEALKEL